MGVKALPIDKVLLLWPLLPNTFAIIWPWQNPKVSAYLYLHLPSELGWEHRSLNPSSRFFLQRPRQHLLFLPEPTYHLSTFTHPTDTARCSWGTAWLNNRGNILLHVFDIKEQNGKWQGAGKLMALYDIVNKTACAAVACPLIFLCSTKASA